MISFCLPPCCCFTWCFRHVKLTKNKIKFVRYETCVPRYLLREGKNSKTLFSKDF